MCRNIKPLFHFEPAATDAEIQDASLQFVRKVSGYTKPSIANKDAFAKAVNDIAATTRTLMDTLVTTAPTRDRETEIAKAKTRSEKRFGQAN